jgi:UV DNA damage endonuclease
MKLGYACINTTLGKEGRFKTITVKSANKLTQEELIKKVKGITVDNLYNTYKILQWNIENNIYMYRMTSNMIPLATHELLEDWSWWNDKDILNICNKIKELVIKNDIRISFHPDQFCVINSPKEEVFNMALDILNYHNRLSDLLGNDILILHVGGIYGDKESAMRRFIDNFNRLPIDIQNKIVLENDDKSYNVEDVLDICNHLGIRMCIDFHHDRCLLSSKGTDWLMYKVITTWKGQTPKCHISSGKDKIDDRSHADYVSSEDFTRVVELTKGRFDIMFECKMKELSVLDYIKEVK